MYFIVVKFQTKPEWTDRWPDLVADFTAATRAEPGNLFFEWSRSLEDPAEFVLVEAFTDDGAGPHVNSDHFKKATGEMGQASSPPRGSSAARWTARAGTPWARSPSNDGNGLRPHPDRTGWGRWSPSEGSAVLLGPVVGLGLLVLRQTVTLER